MTDAAIVRPDLTACDREPIHIPGAIQPHGVLLVVDPGNGTVIQASANAGSLLGVEASELHGMPWRELITFIEGLDEPPERPARSHWQAVTLPAAADSASTSWFATVHFMHERWLVEIEPAGRSFDDDPIEISRDFSQRVNREKSVIRAADRLARTVKANLGYDRVMIYRFDSDWHGEVIAEDRAQALEPYLGLHYPHTDIPAQARALYLRNRVRQISDVLYRPVPIVPVLDPATGSPTDLSDVSLRAVSPVHIEYLANMGVTATLVASIIVGGRLWGLISCHHYKPRFADHLMREFADALAVAFAHRVDAIEELDKVQAEGVLLTVREKLITAFNESERIDAALLGSLAPELLEVVDADGVAVFDGDRIVRHGLLPADETLWRLHAAVGVDPTAGDHDIDGVLHTDAVGERYADLEDTDAMQAAAGIIFMPLRGGTQGAVMWTRGEQVRAVRWAGNPYLSKLEVIPGARLSPRQSFASWQETVRGRSRPWSPAHLESASALRTLIERMERK